MLDGNLALLNSAALCLLWNCCIQWSPRSFFTTLEFRVKVEFIFRLSSKKGVVLLYLLLTAGMQNRVKDKGKNRKPKSDNSGLCSWCSLNKMVSSTVLAHLTESNSPGWAWQVNRGMRTTVCTGNQWKLGTDVSLRLVRWSRLWILTNSCRNTPSPCWGPAAKKQTTVLMSKQFLMPCIPPKDQATRNIGQLLKKIQEFNSHRNQSCNWNQWEFGMKHFRVAEHQLIFFPATICERVFTLFSYLKQWIFDIFPIALVPSKRRRLFQVR